MDCKQLSVSELNSLIKFAIESDGLFNDIWVSGEITQFRHYQKGGQYYFYLAENKASINCVMYTQSVDRLAFQPEVGQQVFARGKLVFFKNKGTVMFQVAYMTPDGPGGKQKDLQALTKQFAKEGLFDASHKRLCPAYPEKIGLITTPDSAAMGDFVTTLRQHNRYSELILFPSVMQGEHAPLSIIENLDLASHHHVDSVAIVRGGGSAQELAVFNNERLCRYLFTYKTPTLCGIGHQTDSHLIDRIVDHSALTPTACAMLLSEPFSRIHDDLAAIHSRFDSAISHTIDTVYQKTHFLFSTLQTQVDHQVHRTQEKVQQLCEELARSNPLNRLRRGYSVTQYKNRSLHSVKNIQKGDKISTRLADGTLISSILEIHDGK